MVELTLKFESNPGEVFIFHDGPPYANGNLHMGEKKPLSF